jgi:hypothetical protein
MRNSAVVGSSEALHHGLSARRPEGLALGVGGALGQLRRRRPIDLERHFPPAEPALRRHLAEIADMVRMQMREQQGVDLGAGDISGSEPR